MHIRLLAASVAVALGTAALTMPAASAGTRGDAGRAVSPLPSPCQTNTNVGTDTGLALPAQLHPASSASLSTKGAVAFRVSATCTINYITAWGKLVGTGPVASANIEVRANVTGGPLGNRPANGAPLAFTNSAPVVQTFSSPYTILTATFSTPYTVPAGALVWVVFQARMNPSLGQWSWEVVQPDPAGIGDEWRNQNGGYGCGTSWKRVSLPCMGGAPGKGLMSEIGT